MLATALKSMLTGFAIAAFAMQYSFAQFNDNFSDTDLNNNPAWTSSDNSGTGTDFLVTNGELQSAGPAATASLSITTSNVPELSGGETEWEFSAKYAYAPSGSNNIEVFVNADRYDLLDNPQGYYIRMGEGGSQDGIDLFRTGSSTPIISDPEPSVAANINVSVRLLRDGNGRWTLQADKTGGTAYVTIGSVVDTTFTTGSFFGFKVSHTSARNQHYYFDNVSLTHQDNIPPAVSAIAVSSDTTLTVIFSEDIAPSTAEEEIYYTMNNGFNNPIEALIDPFDPRSVHLLFSQPMISGVNYTLSITGVQDLAGNMADKAGKSFFYFQEQKALVKDIIINEIFADPYPANDLPEDEFIEIYNNSDKIFDLAGWSFSDRSSIGRLPSFILNPKEFLILCPEEQVPEYDFFGRVIGLSAWPTLNNAGDFLVLQDNHGDTIDAVHYTANWYNNEQKAEGGWSLELINTKSTCHDENNWTASTHIAGGSPGTKNTVYNEDADNTAPMLLSASAVDNSTLRLDFSEQLDPIALKAGKFYIDEMLSAVAPKVSENSYAIILTLDKTLEMNRWYSVKAEGLLDCSGNLTTGHQVEFMLVKNVAVNSKDVIINEIFPAPNDKGHLPDAEFVELLNNSNKILNLKNWTFSDAVSTGTLAEAILFPGDHLIICSAEKVGSYAGYGTVTGVTGWPSLNNTGDELVLRNSEGKEVDVVTYARHWYNSSAKAEGGWSLELIDPERICSDSNNWTASENLSGGTPGKVNAVRSHQPDLNGPRVVEALALQPQNLHMRFDEAVDPQSALHASYILTPHIDASFAGIDDDLKNLSLDLKENLEPATEYTLTIANLSDCTGNMIRKDNAMSFNLIEPADSTDIIINEVLFNPRSGGVEFVELFNRSNKYINLKGWQLVTGKIITDQDLIIQPLQYLALTADAIILKEQYPFGAEEQFLETTGLPAYPNTSGTVLIFKPDSLLMDQFNYSEAYHFSLLTNNKGVSLERVSFTSSTDNAGNWKSAASTVGFATPGYVNSQSRSGIKGEEGNIDIFPKVIIPDGSGQQDFTTISYSFKQPGYVANAKIMDIYGRTIRILSENDYLPAQGFYTWDATEGNGRKVRIGYYLIYFEVFNLDGEIIKFKEKVVVGTRF